MKGIYRFEDDWDRHGTLTGLFVADSDEITAAVGEGYSFGEVLGKHSDIHGTITAEMFHLVTDVPADVEYFERLDLSIGYNPLEYLIE